MNRISYSQYSQWVVCPYKWKLNYIDKLRQFTDNIHTLFGTSMHEVLQKYLAVMYADSIKTANDIDLTGITSGTAMKWKITTHNQDANKQTRIHSMSLGWG